MNYCHDINGVFKGMFQEQNPSEWWGFIRYSQQSLKAVHLHNENSQPSTLIAHSVHLKQTHDEMKILLQAIQYNVQEWGICGDLKMTGMLMEMQAGFTKFCCFLTFGIVALQPYFT